MEQDVKDVTSYRFRMTSYKLGCWHPGGLKNKGSNTLLNILSVSPRFQSNILPASRPLKTFLSLVMLCRNRKVYDGSCMWKTWDKKHSVECMPDSIKAVQMHSLGLRHSSYPCRICTAKARATKYSYAEYFHLAESSLACLYSCILGVN